MENSSEALTIFLFCNPWSLNERERERTRQKNRKWERNKMTKYQLHAFRIYWQNFRWLVGERESRLVKYYYCIAISYPENVSIQVISHSLSRKVLDNHQFSVDVIKANILHRKYISLCVFVCVISSKKLEMVVIGLRWLVIYCRIERMCNFRSLFKLY